MFNLWCQLKRRFNQYSIFSLHFSFHSSFLTCCTLASIVDFWREFSAHRRAELTLIECLECRKKRQFKYKFFIISCSTRAHVKLFVWLYNNLNLVNACLRPQSRIQSTHRLCLPFFLASTFHVENWKWIMNYEKVILKDFSRFPHSPATSNCRQQLSNKSN